jgi:hypothetical protein
MGTYVERLSTSRTFFQVRYGLYSTLIVVVKISVICEICVYIKFAFYHTF